MQSVQRDFVMKTIKNRDVHFVRFWFTDVLGKMKSFAVSTNEVENALEEGMGFDGSCVEGFSPTEESDMIAFPEPDTFQILPWRPANNAVGRMFCTIRTPDGNRFEGDPRYVLRKMCDKAAAQGYIMNIGPEVEYFYFQDEHGTVPLDNGGYFDLTSLDNASDLRRETILTLEKMGIPVEYSHHEGAPSQHEIDLRFNDALSMADAVMTYKMVVKEVAMKHGVFASFMPKPMDGCAGNGMHVHQSLFDFDGNNLFFDANDPDGNNLSDLAKHYMAGLLKYAPEFCLVTNQYVNSYKRIASHVEAPAFISWATKNRSTLLRIPMYKPDKDIACRVEVRCPDPAANPYLAFAVMLAAGLKGIEDELPLPEPTEGVDLFSLTPDELEERGIKMLPDNLGKAIELFEKSELMKETLGEHIHSFLVDEKRREWQEYQSTVSQWELDKYLGSL